MLDESNNFVRLPHENVLIVSPARVALALQTPNPYPGTEPLAIKCNEGKAIITNQRLIYLPATPTTEFKSLQAPLLSLHDTHVTAPFFGPNAWEGILIPTAGGGFAAHHHVVQIKLTFKEGGAFDFQSTFERIKEQVAHAAEIAREGGRTTGNANVPVDVDLEQLPAYEEVGSVRQVQHPQPSQGQTLASQIQRPTPISPNGTMNSTSYRDETEVRMPQSVAPTGESFSPPNEPPPGYEEVQSNSVADNLERRLRNEH
ncbi:MAG: hypothetical protein Q9163_005370 [Psora crenata]